MKAGDYVIQKECRGMGALLLHRWYRVTRTGKLYMFCVPLLAAGRIENFRMEQYRVATPEELEWLAFRLFEATA